MGNTNEKNEKIISKIKKMMAIANDPSASDQEIQLSAYRARKLMIEHKISEIDLFGVSGIDGQKKENVECIRLEETGTGYFIWILKVVAEHFQCKAFFNGKINRNDCRFGMYGLKEDVDVARIVAEGLLYYINHMLTDLKECYIGDVDFRVYKRDYIDGFSNGLETALDKALIEMHVDKKYELAVIGVPAVVEEVANSNIKKVKSKFHGVSMDGYNLGQKHGSQYDINTKNLVGSSREPQHA